MKKFMFDLQLFSEGSEPTEPSVEPDVGLEPKTFTQDEVDEIIQKRLSREKKQQEEVIRETIKKEQEEAKRLAELSAEERAKEIENKSIKEVEQLKLEIKRRDLELDTTQRLKEEGLDISFKSFLMGDDAEKTNENIKAFKSIYDEKVQEEVEKRLAGKSPNISSTALGETSDIGSYAADKRIIK